MRAGNLDRTIVIQAYSSTIDEYGTPVEAWTDLATMRAQIVQASTDEFVRNYGEGAESVIVFRTRWLDGVTAEHRVTYEDAGFNIKEVKEIGRRRGLELRCVSTRTEE
jgi:SPP1 family predicted phage head-tail adaptor